jgi:CRISPR/Cas system CSM-associated protein Csm2 small subunit
MAGEENERIVTTRNLGCPDSSSNTDELIEAMPKDLIDTEYRRVFKECSNRIEQFGSQRKEYIILAVHTCDVRLRAKCAAKARQAE